MDFTLSLAHFCENDGPTSILCTQMLPISCLACYPPAFTTPGNLDLGGHNFGQGQHQSHALDEGHMTPAAPVSIPNGRYPEPRNLQNGEFISPVSPTDALGEGHMLGESPESPRGRPYKVLGDGGGCVSCTMSVPQKITSKLPLGAPGSPKADGMGRNGSPILRSKESVHACASQHSESDDEEPSIQHSSPESFISDASSTCHTHVLTYITTSSPIDPNTYATLRRSSIRTLSCEQLPRGLTAGPLFFGNPTIGYTIAHKFRLRDPHARGRQRYYALLALAGNDPARAFKAASIVFKAFQQIAAGITEHAASAEVKSPNGERPTYTPVSSFLTGRTMDPDGYPRRPGNAIMRARGLAEIVGNDLFFAELHKDFVLLLQNLGRLLGGLRVESPIYDGGVRKM